MHETFYQKGPEQKVRSPVKQVHNWFPLKPIMCKIGVQLNSYTFHMVGYVKALKNVTLKLLRDDPSFGLLNH